MTEKKMLEILLNEKFIAIFRGIPTDMVGEVGKAIAESGVRFIEITYNHKDPNLFITFAAQAQAVKDALGESVILGAGTVLTEEQVDFAVQCGCKFIVSPNTDVDVIKRVKELGCISIPGAMSPSEIVSAYKSGADVVKLYIIEDPQYVKYLQGPLGHIPLQATCNVSPSTIPVFMKAGVKLFGTRAFITNEMIEKKQYSEMSKAVTEYLNAIRNYK